MQTLLARLRSGVIEDGTAIGNGLATAINRLRETGGGIVAVKDHKLLGEVQLPVAGLMSVKPCKELVAELALADVPKGDVLATVCAVYARAGKGNNPPAAPNTQEGGKTS